MIKFQKGDTVKITSGKDKGREATIELVDIAKRTALLPGINIYKRHIKAAFAADQKGGIYDIPRPVDFAKIALICPNCKKQTRVGFRVEGDKKVRVCKKCDRVIEIKAVRTKKG
jgi:large subunit ribosomal protein L24